jgi:hypothetical protein
VVERGLGFSLPPAELARWDSARPVSSPGRRGKARNRRVRSLREPEHPVRHPEGQSVAKS